VNISSETTRSKLLIVGGFPPEGAKVYGGIVTSCRALVNSQFAEIFQLELLDTTQISNPPPMFLVRLVLASRRFMNYLVKLIIFRPDTVLLFTSRGASLVEKGMMAWVARCLGVPSMIFPRGGALMVDYDEQKWQQFWIRFLLKGAKIFLCQGPSWQRFAIDKIGFPQQQTEVVLNWTATSDLLLVGTQRKVEETNPEIRFLFVGWLEREKGIFELLEACAALAKERKFLLTIAGRGRVEREAMEYVKSKGLDQHVSFSGWVEGASLVELYSKHDVFVLPSWTEGFPNSMIEAMACKLAVIVTDVGNIPDLVSDGEQALLIPSRNVEALKRAMLLMMDNPSAMRGLAQCGHLMAIEKFSVGKAVDSLVTAVGKCINLS
jgi:glycosyltransferase involved in cell wall biosynthesis